MAVKIRLQRIGTKGVPAYRLVAIDSRSRRDGRAVEILGTFQPKAKRPEEFLRADGERLRYWLGVGATPSETAWTLIKRLKAHLPAETVAAADSSAPAPAAVVEA